MTGLGWLETARRLGSESQRRCCGRWRDSTDGLQTLSILALNLWERVISAQGACLARVWWQCYWHKMSGLHAAENNMPASPVVRNSPAPCGTFVCGSRLLMLV